MPLPNGYACLKGRVIAKRLATLREPHYQIHVFAAGKHYRVAVNVRSNDGGKVAYLVRKNFEHPITDALADLPEGCTDIESKPGGIALDFIRGNLAQPKEFVPLPATAAGADNDLNDKLDAVVRLAISDRGALIYAFGEPWGPEPYREDGYFGFLPGRGIHDVHMNQGSPRGPHAAENGPWQDGGLIFQFKRVNRWVAVLLKFQNQAWHSRDDDGEPVETAMAPEGPVRIVAALVNGTGTPEHETVTLVNTADTPIDLGGWSIKDRRKNAMALSGTIEAGQARVITVEPPLSLSNRGGIISLLDGRGFKVHGVSYTKEQAGRRGKTIRFPG